MIVYDVATKVLDTELFPQHTIAELNSGITFFFIQPEDFAMKANNHTHIHSSNVSLKLHK